MNQRNYINLFFILLFVLRILFTFPDWFENCLLIFRSLFVHIPELFIDILIFVRHVLDLFSASTVYSCNASCTETDDRDRSC